MVRGERNSELPISRLDIPADASLTTWAGTVLHAVGVEGVAMRDVAGAIAEQTGLAAAAVDPDTLEIFGALLGGDQPASSAATRAS